MSKSPESLAWSADALAAPHTQPDKAARVQAMFDAIAPTYERVNRVASLGQDGRWRRTAIRLAALRGGETCADICCGTGDMVRLLATAAPRPRLVLGLDFAAGMLAGGRYDSVPPGAAAWQLLRADGQRLPLRDASVDLVTCAFGVRNFQSLAAGLGEMRRVLRAGGRAVILEFAPPAQPLIRWGYKLYTEGVLPRLGEWLSGDRSGAYRYLPRSIDGFSTRADMIRQLEQAGFGRVQARGMNLGTVVAYRADL